MENLEEAIHKSGCLELDPEGKQDLARERVTPLLDRLSAFCGEHSADTLLVLCGLAEIEGFDKTATHEAALWALLSKCAGVDQSLVKLHAVRARGENAGSASKFKPTMQPCSKA